MTWLLARLSQAALVVFAMTLIVFVGVHVIGNPADILISPEADQAERARALAALRLDQPLWLQYVVFLEGAAGGRLGNSFATGQPALPMILARMPATIELAIAAVILAVGVGVPLGLYAGLRPDTLLSRFLMTVSILGFSIPTFWVALMLIVLFAVELGWLPSGGRGSTVELFGTSWSFLTQDGLRHLLLPAFSLALFKLSLVLRLTRAGVREIVQMDYVRYARAKGLGPGRILGVHILKNIMIPIVTVVGLEFASTVAFAVVTETIFGWPGMGKLIVDSINVLDRPVIVAYLMVVVVLFVFVNLIVDVTYTLLDPRVRAEARA